MPNNDDVKPSAGPSFVQTRHNWLQKAKDFLITNCGMYDMGDNARLNISENHINAGVVVIASISHVDKGDSQEANEQSHGPKIPVAQDDARPKDEEPPITLVPSQKKYSTSSPDLDNAFDSEATADYADLDVPMNSSKAYPCASRARTHIYSLEMLTHGAGYPLYMPTPSRGLPAAYRKKGIRVGDVGVITPNGAFDFLFNACQQDGRSDAGVNPAALPDGFELLKAIIRVNDRFDHGECLPSDHVNESCDPELHTFRCSASEGAVLALPTGATIYEAVNTHHFETHAALHGASWYEYVLKEGRDVSNGSLYFVTECIKSNNWGIAVFYGRTTASDGLRLIFNEESCQWGRRAKVEARVGPKSKDILLSDDDDDEPNQCVFLRGFKIMLRPDVWDKLKSSIVVTTQDGESSSAPFPTRTTHSQTQRMSDTSQAHQSTTDSHNAPGHNARLDANQLMHMHVLQAVPRKVVKTSDDRPLWLGQVILEDNFREAAPLHPSDLVNAMLLHLKPEASIALVHDSVWCNQLPHDFMADPVNPNVYGLLDNIKQAYKAVVGQHGNAVLVDIQMESKASDDLYACSPILSQNDEDTVMSDAIERSCSQGIEPETLDDWKGKSQRQPFDLVKEYLSAQELELLGERGISDAIHMFVDNDDTRAIETHVARALNSLIKDVQGKTIEGDVDEDSLHDMLMQAKEQHEEDYEESAKAKMTRDKARNKCEEAAGQSNDSMMMDIDAGGGGGSDFEDWESIGRYVDR